MDAARLISLFRVLAVTLSRRGVARAVAGSTLAAALSPLLGFTQADAKKKHKHKKRKKKKVKFNDFDCVNVGSLCKNAEQCCSGICEGKQGQKHCQAHDQSTCRAGQTTTGCGGTDVACLTSTGNEHGLCHTTTGNAGYCYTSGNCFPCKKDADCVGVCGHLAACIVCETSCAHVPGSTGCVGPSADSCIFP